MARGRTPRQTCDGSGLAFLKTPDEILQVLTYRLFVSQVMIMLHQTVEQRLVGGSPYLLQFDGLKLAQRSGDGRRVDQHGRRRLASRERIERDLTNCRK